MLVVPLEPVNQPDPRSLTIFEIPGIPRVSGQGEVSYECPACKSILLENIDFYGLTRIAFRCPKCGTLSRMHKAMQGRRDTSAPDSPET